MIIEIKVSNYRSINAEQTISFVADKSTRLPENLIKQKEFKLLKSIGIFGANSAGKSNFVRAITIARRYIHESATHFNEGDMIPYSEFHKFRDTKKDQGSGFEISFVSEAHIYRYGFVCDMERVQKEYLYRKKVSEKNENLIFERLFDISENIYKWHFDTKLAPHSSLIIERTRTNALVLSSASRENIELFKKIYSYIVFKIMPLNMAEEPGKLLHLANNVYMHDDNMLQKVLEVMKTSDIGIENITIVNNSKNDSDITKRYKSEFPNQYLDSLLDFMNFNPWDRQHSIVVTRQDMMGNIEPFDLQLEESEGTKRLFSLIGPLLTTFNEGGLLVIDELDASMHPIMTRSLIELFQDPEVNKNGAQLLFTTHDTVLLDNQLFRRDQIWLAQKRNNASEFYSLADIVPPPRNTEAYLKNYMAGRYGGTPQINVPLRFALRKEDE